MMKMVKLRFVKIFLKFNSIPKIVSGSKQKT